MKGAANGFEPFLIILDKIHLVDGDDDMPDAKKGSDKCVAARLAQNALSRIYQHDCHVGIGRTGRHVTGIFLVSGRIRDNEFSLRRHKEAVGYIDRDALFPLSLQAVHQKREIQMIIAFCRAMLFGIPLKRGKLVIQDKLRIVEQSADQRGFPVVHRATGQNAQEGIGDVRVLLNQHVVFKNHPHQKYPSRFFFSIEASSSESIARP